MPYTSTPNDGYVGLFFVPDAGVPIAHVNINVGTSSFSVSEKVIATGNTVSSIAEADLTLFVDSGTITTVVLEKRLAAQKSTNTLYFPRAADAFWWSALNTKKIVITYNSTPEEYVFKFDPSGDKDVLIPDFTGNNRIIRLMENLRNKINTAGPGVSAFVSAKLSGPTALRLIAKTGGTAYNAGMALASEDQYITPKGAIELNGMWRNAFSGGANAPTAAWSHAVTAQVAQEINGTNWVEGDDYTQEFIIPGMSYSATGIDWEFRARFFNADMQEALTHTEPYAVARLESGTVTFNGVNDLSEYAEVTGLVCANGGSSGAEGGGGSNSSITLTGRTAILTWDDMSVKYDVLTNHPLGRTIETGHIGSAPYCDPQGNTIDSGDIPITGSGVQLHQREISRITLSCLDHYAVFIYTSSGTQGHLDPSRDWPTDDEPYGDWSFVATTYSNSINIPLVQNKYVGFWVGFATPNTFDNGGTNPPFHRIYREI